MNASPEAPTLADYIGAWPTCQPLSGLLAEYWDELDARDRARAMSQTPARDPLTAMRLDALPESERPLIVRDRMAYMLCDMVWRARVKREQAGRAGGPRA